MAAVYTRSSVYATSGSLAHGIGTGDFTVAMWVYPTSSGTADRCFWTNGTLNPAVFQDYPSGAFGIYTGSARTFDTVFSTNTWYHIAVRRSSGNLTGWVNGTQEATTYSGVTNSFGDAAQGFATDVAGSSSDGYSGRIAEAGLWTAALDSAEIGALADGYSPLFIRRASIKFYYPFVRNTVQDLIRANTLTESGTVTVASHPRIFYPRTPKIFRFSSPAVTQKSFLMRKRMNRSLLIQ